MPKANPDRIVAEALMRAHQADWGPTGSNPSLQTTVTSETLYQQLTEAGEKIGPDAVKGVLRNLAAQDYISIAPGDDGDVLTVRKIYPVRMKRDFNLWHVAEEYEG